MTNLYFEELMKEFNCEVIGITALGMNENFPYSAEIEEGSSPTIIIFRFVLKANAKEAATALKAKAVAHIRWVFEYDEHAQAVVGILTPPSDFYAKAEIHSLLQVAKETFTELSLATPEECPVCTNENCDSYSYFKNGFRKIHSACLQNFAVQNAEISTNNAPLQKEIVRGNYITGILGALLGAIIAALPNFSTAISKGKIHAVLYVFIPILSALLYRLLRGKASKFFSSLTVLISSIATAFFLEIFWFWVFVTNNFLRPITFWQSSVAYFENNTFVSTVQNMAISLVFLMVGYFVSTVFLRRYVASGTKKTQPIHGTTFAQKSLYSISHFEKDDKNKIT